MNEAHVKAVIVDEVEKYLKIRHVQLYHTPVESVKAKVVSYDNNFGEVSAILIVDSTFSFGVFNGRFFRALINNGKLTIEEYFMVKSEFIYLEKGVL